MKKVRQKSTARQQAKKARNSGSRRVLRRERGWQHFCASHLPQIVVGCISVALLLIALIGAHLPAFANATLTTRASTFSSPHPLETGGLLRFTDPKDRTALSVQTNPNDTH